jgi:hypothetical protein
VCIGEGYEQLVQFGGHKLTGLERTRRRAHLVTDAVQPSTLEGTPEHVEHAIDEAPGQVAAENADQHQPGTLAALFLDDKVRAERERERHDQPEQRLAHVRPGVEVLRSESRHGPALPIVDYSPAKCRAFPRPGCPMHRRPVECKSAMELQLTSWQRHHYSAVDPACIHVGSDIGERGFV